MNPQFLRNIFYLTAPLFLLLTGGCKKTDELLTFYVEDQQDIFIESQLSVQTLLPVPVVPVTTNSTAEFSQNNTNTDKVKNVSLNNLTLTITDPPGKTFSFLKNVEIFISTNANDEVRLAYLSEVPQNAGNSIDLKTTGEKLDKYLKAATYSIRTKATTDEAFTQDITIRAKMRFKVTADPL